MDSFIDDATQLTQRTPSTTKQRHASSPVDMMAVYRQSLRSPVCGALNFRTPLFHKQRNKYKMVYKHRNVDDESQSEAEETYESESVLENEVETEDESEDEKRDSEIAQMSGKACADASFEESQIGRPVKRMKRKRILDDSLDGDVSPKLRKQGSLSKIYDQENAIESNAVDTNKHNAAQMRETNQRKSGAFGNFSTKVKVIGDAFHSDFVKSSDFVAEKRNFHENNSALRRSAGDKRESMRKSGAFLDDWNNDISDSELLVVLEDKGVRAPVNTSAKR